MDDDGYGYADNGKEYYDEDDYRYSSDDGNDVKKNASTAKNDGVRKKLKRTEKPQKVNAAFLKSAAAMGNVAKVNSSSLDRLMKKPQEIEQLASLVDDLDKGLEMEVDIPEELSKAEDIALFGQSIQVQEAHRRISRKAASQDVVNALPNSDGDDFNENVEASSSQDRNIKKIRVVSEPPQEIQTLTTDDKPNLAEVSLSVSGFSSLKQSDSSFNEHTKIGAFYLDSCS